MKTVTVSVELAQRMTGALSAKLERLDADLCRLPLGSDVRKVKQAAYDQAHEDFMELSNALLGRRGVTS